MNRRTNVRGALICFNICTPNNPPSCGHDGAESCSWGFLDSSGFWPGADIGMKMYRDQHIATEKKKSYAWAGIHRPPPLCMKMLLPGTPPPLGPSPSGGTLHSWTTTRHLGSTLEPSQEWRPGQNRSQRYRGSVCPCHLHSGLLFSFRDNSIPE